MLPMIAAKDDTYAVDVSHVTTDTDFDELSRIRIIAWRLDEEAKLHPVTYLPLPGRYVIEHWDGLIEVLDEDFSTYDSLEVLEWLGVQKPTATKNHRECSEPDEALPETIVGGLIYLFMSVKSGLCSLLARSSNHYEDKDNG